MKNILILSRTLSIILLFCLFLSPPLYAQDTVNITLKDTQNRAILLNQSKQSDSFSLPIESSNSIKLILTSNSELAISLQSPDFNTYTQDNIESINGTFLMFDATGTSGQCSSLLPITGGVNYIFTIPNPTTGIWTVNVSATVLQDDIGVFFTFYGTSNLKAGLATNKTQYSIGETIVIAAVVNEGDDPFNNASAVAIVSSPSSNINISLLDDGINYDADAGDGIFSGSLVASEVGEHKISAKIEGSYQGNTFLKDLGTTFYVNEQLAEFTNDFNDYGVDSDNDGLINKIVIETEAYVYKTGEYDLKIALKSENGNVIYGHNTLMANTIGASMFIVEFTAEELRGLNSSDPLTVSEATLENISESPTKLADQISDAWQTKAYDLNTLEEPDIYVTNNITDNAIDNNSNSLYDILKIDLGVNLLYSGFYRWSIKLTDKENKEIETINGFGNLSTGLNIISLNFDGAKIGQNKVNGPFYVKDLLFWGNGKSLTQNYIYATQFYRYVDFEGAPLKGDLNYDNSVDALDRNALRISLGKCDGDPSYLENADYDGDNCITYNDYRIWYGYYKDFINK